MGNISQFDQKIVPLNAFGSSLLVEILLKGRVQHLSVSLEFELYSVQKYAQTIAKLSLSSAFDPLRGNSRSLKLVSPHILA